VRGRGGERVEREGMEREGENGVAKKKKEHIYIYMVNISNGEGELLCISICIKQQLFFIPK
jgi:hypothetical protein